MRKSNKAKNSTLSSNFLLLFLAKILSILMIVASSSSSAMQQSSLSSVAFASHGGDYHGDRSIPDIARGSNNNNNNQVGQYDLGLIGNLISQQQQSPQADARNINVDNIGNLISQQQSPQADARNINVDNRVIIVEGCEGGDIIINDNDQIIQTNTQSFNQEANNQVGEEEEDDDGNWGLIGNLISQQQSPQADARNINVDNRVIIVEDCEGGDIIINDNDQIIQTNTQSFNQEANNQVGEEEEDDDD